MSHSKKDCLVEDDLGYSWQLNMRQELQGFEKESKQTSFLDRKISWKQEKEFSASLYCGKISSGFLWPIFGADKDKWNGWRKGEDMAYEERSSELELFRLRKGCWCAGMKWRRGDCQMEEKQLVSAWRGLCEKSRARAAAGKLRAVRSHSGWEDPAPWAAFQLCILQVSASTAVWRTWQPNSPVEIVWLGLDRLDKKKSCFAAGLPDDITIAWGSAVFNDFSGTEKSLAGFSDIASQKLWWALMSLRQCNIRNQPSRASQGLCSQQLFHRAGYVETETWLHSPELCSFWPNHAVTLSSSQIKSSGM